MGVNNYILTKWDDPPSENPWMGGQPVVVGGFVDAETGGINLGWNSWKMGPFFFF